jgi:hypothetical protein
MQELFPTKYFYATLPPAKMKDWAQRKENTHSKSFNHVNKYLLISSSHIRNHNANLRFYCLPLYTSCFAIHLENIKFPFNAPCRFQEAMQYLNFWWIKLAWSQHFSEMVSASAENQPSILHKYHWSTLWARPSILYARVNLSKSSFHCQ